MAAGRHGGYRNHEFRDRELDLGVSRQRDFYCPVEEYGRFRDGGRECDSSCGSRKLERGKEHGYEDRVRSRQRDVEEPEAVNSVYHSSSSMNDSGSSRKRDGSSVRIADREPGELSSGSGSDDANISEWQVRENGNWEFENGNWSPAARKRKFSPIAWDREDKLAAILSRNKIKTASIPIPPCPPQTQGLCRSLHFNQSKSVRSSSPIESRSFHKLQPSTVKSPIAPVSVGSAQSDLLAGFSPALRPEQHWNNSQELGNAEDEEDHLPTQNISVSRWANVNNSPRDEDEVSDEEQVLKKGKKMPGLDLVAVRLNKKVQSPELGELTRECSEGSQAKSSNSDGGHCVEPASEVEYTDIDLERDDFMDVDGEDVNHDVGHQAETYSGENDSREILELLVPPKRSINMLQGCRSVHEFEKLNRIDEGTYGVVFRAKDKKTGEIVALKKVKMEKEREGFPMTYLREINILLSFHHPSIVDVKEVVVGSKLDGIFMVMEYMEHDLKGLMETMRQPFSQSEVKCLMKQLLEGVKYLHDNWVLHRDLKTSNLLLNNHGELKICDFGLSRQYGSPLKPYTPLVVTLWYRAPELLLGAKQYSTAIDMWSLGCIMAELLAKEPLFNGKSEFDQLDKIFRTLGTPNEKIWPGFRQLPGVKFNFIKQQYNKLRDKFPPTSFSGRPTLSESGFDLLNKLLTYDPEKRIMVEAALDHEWFREVPLPKSKDFMPTFPAQHAQDRRLRRTMKIADPLEELGRRHSKGN